MTVDQSIRSKGIWRVWTQHFRNGSKNHMGWSGNMIIKDFIRQICVSLENNVYFGDWDGFKSNPDMIWCTFCRNTFDINPHSHHHHRHHHHHHHPFLAATKQLYKWYFPSICPSVRPSVTPFYTPVFRRDVLWYGAARPFVRPFVRPSDC